MRKSSTLSQEIKVGESYTWTFEFSGKPVPAICWMTDKEMEIASSEKFSLKKDDCKTSLTIKNAIRKVKTKLILKNYQHLANFHYSLFIF